MEKLQTDTSETPIYRPPCRKSHLKSQTYFILAHILSQCVDHPELCRPARIDPQELRPDNSGNELGDASEKEVQKYNELVAPLGMDHNNVLAQGDLPTLESVKGIGIQDEGFSDSHTIIDEIENIINTEEDDYPCKKTNLTANNCTNGTSFQGEEFGDLQQLLMDELEHAIKGNEEVARDNNSNLTVHGKQCGSDVVAFSDSQEGHIDLQSIVMPGCSNTSQQQVDIEHSSQNTYETIDSSLCTGVTCEVSKLSDNNEDKISLFRNNESESNVAAQVKEMDFQKPVHVSGADSCCNRMTEGIEMEEGEIAGEFEVRDRSVMSHGEAAMLQEQRKHPSEDVDKNKTPSSDKEEENRMDFGKATTREKVEANGVKNEMVRKRKIVVYEDLILAEETDHHKRQKKDCETKEPRKANGDKGKKKGNVDQIVCSNNNSASSIQNSDQTTTGDKSIMSRDKDGLCNKKKRGPPSEEKKAKKKEKKRKKRAQKNREFGVKRLKLRPVQNPKPVAYCRHYINGRCHEGGKCKFSHDTVPLTKSKPCGHFARKSCLKGDDCPFDHELSRYPCSNFVSTGSCSRGGDCLFSHKLPLKEDVPSTSNVSTPDLKATSLPVTSSSKKQLDSGGTSHHFSRASPGTLRFKSCKSTVQNVAKSVLTPMLAPKGISFLSGISSISESNPSTPSSSSLTRNGSFKDGNKADESTFEKTHSSDTPKGTQPSIAPKGINFLSFGKTPVDLSRSKNLTCNSGSKLSLLNSFSFYKQPNPTMGSAVQVGRDMTSGVSGTASWLNCLLQKNELAAAPTKSNILSYGESSRDGRCKTQSSLLSSSVSNTGSSVQASKISPDVHQSSSVTSQKPRSASLSSSPSAHYSAHSWLKDAPNSAQKALTTLAFAAKAESEMKMKQSMSGSFAVSSKATNKTGDRDSSTPINLKNDSVKTLKILDFLSSFSGEKAQNMT